MSLTFNLQYRDVRCTRRGNGMKAVIAVVIAITALVAGAAPDAATVDFDVRVGPSDTYPGQGQVFAAGVMGLADVVYATRYGYRPLALDLYLPARHGAGPLPMLVYVHGGAWVTGDKRNGGPIANLPELLAATAAHGYVVASISYRLRNEARFPAQIEDVKDALRFLRRNAGRFGIDARRIGIVGGSAGGHLAALTGTSCGVAALEAEQGEQAPGSTHSIPEPGDECVQAAVSWFGVHDFTTVPTPPGQTGPGPFLGCTTRPCPRDVLRFASPVTYVDPTDPPMLLIHGSADKLVAPSQTTEFRDALLAAQVPVTAVFIPDVDHGFVGKSAEQTAAANREALRLTVEFFDRVLRNIARHCRALALVFWNFQTSEGDVNTTPAPATTRDVGRCPVTHTDYRIERAALWHNKDLNASREASPVYWNDSVPHGFWMITRYEQVLEALGMPEVFSNRQVNAFDNDMRMPLLPQNLNGSAHRALRGVLNPFFSPPAVKRLETLARERARTLIDEIRPGGSTDFVVDFAIRYPTELFLALLGLPTSDGQMFLGWVEGIFEGFFGGEEAAARAASAGANIKDYFERAVEERRRQPGDPKLDLVTRLLQAEVEGKRISREDILTICMTLMAAGLDTTRSALGYVLFHLARNDDDRRRLRAHPDEWPRALEEFMRLYALVIQDGRFAERDIEFHGCSIRRGDMLWLGLASANRDPRKFDEPDRFVMDRPNLNDHLGFGSGPHRCLGQYLAKAELLIALREWHEQIPDYRVADGVALRERGGQLRLVSLPLVWR